MSPSVFQNSKSIMKDKLEYLPDLEKDETKQVILQSQVLIPFTFKTKILHFWVFLLPQPHFDENNRYAFIYMQGNSIL